MTTEEFVSIMIKWGNFKARCKSDFPKTVEAKKNKELEDKHKGKRCFIIGNGPSIKRQNLNLLENEIVFVVNGFYRYEGYQKIKPNYYVFADAVFFQEDTGPMALTGFEKIWGYSNKPTIIVPFGTQKMIHNVYGWDKKTSIYYYDGSMSFEDGYVKKWDMSKTVPSPQNVVQVAMLTATYMGFKEIYLLGIEQTDIISCIEGYMKDGEILRYAYEVDDNLRKVRCKNKLVLSLEEDLKGYARIFHLYKEIYHFCAAQGIDVYNCTPETLVKGIPKKNYEEIFRNE